jgi:hypothetical protein
MSLNERTNAVIGCGFVDEGELAIALDAACCGRASVFWSGGR